MQDNFGLKIGVEGEKEFKNSLRDINQSFKVLGSEMNLVSSQFDKQDKSIQAVSARNAVLNKEIDSQKDKITTLKSALDNASASFGENDRRTQAWGIKLNNAKADLNGMEKELGQNKQALDGTGNQFSDAEKKANQFGDEVKSTAVKTDNAGLKFDKLGGIMKGVGKAMAIGVVAVGTAAVGAAVGAYKLSESASNLVESQNVVTATFKTSSKQVLDWTNGISNSAGIGKTAATTMVGSMGAMLKSSGLTEASASGMSEKMVQLSGDMASFYNLDNDTAWEKIRSGISGETEPLKQLGINMSVANLGAYALSQGIKTPYASMTQGEQTTLRYNFLMKTTADAQGDFVKTSGGMANQQRLLQMNFDNISQPLGAMFLPTVNASIKSVNDIATAFNTAITSGKGFDQLGAIVSLALTDLLAKVSTALPGVTAAAVSILTQLVSSFLASIPIVLPALINGVVLLLGAFTQILQANAPMLIAAGMNAITTLISGLMAALPQLTTTALQLLLALADGIVANLPALITSAITMVVTLANGIAAALPKLLPSVVAAIAAIVTTLLQNMPKIITAALNIIQGLARGLLNALPTLINALPAIITAIVSFIVRNLPQIVSVGISMIVQLAVGLIQAIPQLVAKIPEIISAIARGFGLNLSPIKTIGTNIITGLWNGIQSMAVWLQNKVSGFMSGIVNNVKGILGIHSPSTVFAGIGDNMAKGLGIGFGDAMNGITTDMQSAIPTDFDVKANVNVNAVGGSFGGIGGGTGSSTNGGFTLHIDNFVNNTEKDVERLAYEFEFYRQRASLAKGGA